MVRPGITGDDIRAARHAAKLSQPDFAVLAGVGVRTLATWEGCGPLPIECRDESRLGLNKALHKAQRRAERLNGGQTNGQAKGSTVQTSRSW